MKVFFTADTHFNHANIIKYCNRPFYKEEDFLGSGELSRKPWKSEKIKSDRCYYMDSILIKNWNNIVSPDDIVYHLGDFGFLNTEEFIEYLNKLNGHIVLIKGNHDDKNKVKTYLDKAMMSFGGKEVFAQHHPPEEIPICDFVICGHIHNNWKFKIHKQNPSIPIINVGVDVNQYAPVSTNSVLRQYREIKGKYCRLNKYGEFKEI